MTEILSFLDQRNYFSERIRSVCPKCLRVVGGVVFESENRLLMKKTCPDHGTFKTAIGTDLQTYKNLCQAARKITRPRGLGAPSALGCPHDCGLCPSHDQHTCLAILEITSRCNLGCPICLAGSRPAGQDLKLEDIEHALWRLADFEGNQTALQISGGEPTLHPGLSDIVKLASSLGYRRLELNTNGVALSSDRSLGEILREAGLTSVYLQMDSLDPAVSRIIRGQDLVDTKKMAIENCLKAGLEIVFSVTIVPGVNDHELWEMVRLGVEHKITGVNFQALTLSGRYPQKVGNEQERFTSGHFLREIERQSKGALCKSDLSPIPCPDPRCGLICYILIHEGKFLPLNRLIAENQLIDCLADLKDWPQALQHIQSQCFGPCDCPTNGPNLQDYSDILPRADFFSIGFHGMMDAYSLDLDRVKRCCVHEITREGKLIPFCLYNIKYRASL